MGPSLLCGGESWPARGKEISRINAAEMKCFRRIAGKTRRDRIRNERIKEDLGQERIENILVKRQLKSYGHVVRMRGNQNNFWKQDLNEEDQEEGRERVMRME
jgi:hypothetical protein